MQHIHPKDLIIIDIETAPMHFAFNDLSTGWQELWEEKVKRILPAETSPAEFFEQRAGVMAEFAKVVCISMGYFLVEENLRIRIKSFYGHDEKQVLTDFLKTMERIESINPAWQFAGHNIKEFDIPFLCRRMVINEIKLPPFMDFQNMKPWETNIVDTFQYWRFGDYKNFTSLKLLAAALGIPSPKTDIDGSKVAEVYWKQNDIERIAKYCQQDVVTVANVFLKLKGMPIVPPQDVEYKT